MKKFLKMMLVMSLVALALSGCNVFGNDDDDDDGQNLNAIKFPIKKACALTSNSASICSNVGTTTFSKATLGSKNLGCIVQIYNEGDENLTDLTFNFYLEKNGTLVTYFFQGNGTDKLTAKSYLPSESESYCLSSATSSATLINNLNNGTYQIVFEVKGGTKESIDINITD